MADLDAQINALAFSPDGLRLAVAVGDETVRVFALSGSDEPNVLQGRFGPVASVAFSSDGAELATGGDRGLRIWDWRRGVVLLTARRADGVRFLATSGDAPTVAAYGYDEVVRVTTCDVCGPIDEVLGLVPERTTRALSDEERADFKTDG